MYRRTDMNEHMPQGDNFLTVELAVFMYKKDYQSTSFGDEELFIFTFGTAKVFTLL